MGIGCGRGIMPALRPRALFFPKKARGVGIGCGVMLALWLCSLLFPKKTRRGVWDVGTGQGQSQGMPRMRRQYRSKVSRRWRTRLSRAARPLASHSPSWFLYSKKEKT